MQPAHILELVVENPGLQEVYDIAICSCEGLVFRCCQSPYRFSPTPSLARPETAVVSIAIVSTLGDEDASLFEEIVDVLGSFCTQRGWLLRVVGVVRSVGLELKILSDPPMNSLNDLYIILGTNCKYISQAVTSLI